MTLCGIFMITGIEGEDHPKALSYLQVLRDHVDRMFNSARIYRIPIPYERQDIEAAVQRHTTAWQAVLDHCGMAPGP